MDRVETVVAQGMGRITTLTGRVLLASVVLITLSALWLAGESHYRSCVSAASARYPSTPVSAFTGKDTGPLKVAFVNERQKAVDGCHRLPV